MAAMAARASILRYMAKSKDQSLGISRTRASMGTGPGKERGTIEAEMSDSRSTGKRVSD